MKTTQQVMAALVTVFALCFFASPAHARPPRARELSVTIQSVRSETRTLIVAPADGTSAREYVWTKSTEFVENNRVVDAAALKEGTPAKIYYHTPFFGKPYVSKVAWLTENSPPKKT